MKVSWVVASGYQLDPTVDVESLKQVGPIWGSWSTWRSCGTDNVICHDFSKAKELVDRNFHTKSNFFTHREHFQPLGRPTGINMYDGSYSEQVDSLEDIIAMHLASVSSEIILLLGFDFGKITPSDDPFETHKLVNRHGLMRSIIARQSEIQWVAVDQHDLDLKYQELPNLTCDTFKNVLQLLAQ